MNASYNLKIHATGEGLTAAYVLPADEANAPSPVSMLPVTLAAGDNLIALPAGRRKIRIRPPVASAVTKILKWAASGIGVPEFEIAPARACAFGIPAGKTVLNIYASGAETIRVDII